MGDQRERNRIKSRVDELPDSHRQQHAAYRNNDNQLIHILS